MAENFFGLTDTGMVRGNNEDTFIAQTATNGKYILASAIDGVGGYSGGEVAAALARDSIVDYFGKSGNDIIAMMDESLVIANEKIYTERIEVKEHESMACVLTLAVVDIENNEFYYIHVGDTRLYLLRDGSLIKLTKDQSFVGFLEDTGRLSEEAAMSHPKRNEINKALGFSRDLERNGDYFETGRSPFLPGDMLLLCSDGLTDMVNKQDITDILTGDSSLEEMARQLISAANSKGGKDNITAVLVKNDKPFQKQHATKPLANAKKKVLEFEELQRPGIGSELIQPESEPVRRKKNLAMTVLSLLCTFLLLSSIYLLWELGTRKEKLTEQETVAPGPIRTESEQKFFRALSTFTGDSLILNDSVYRNPIIVTDTLRIEKDTLYILARGKIVFQRDSLYKGPALLIPSGTKSIVLNGLIFEGFEVGIESRSKGLKLEGVQFLNCRVPLQYQFKTPSDNYLNGSLSEIFLRTDSLALPTAN
ncbi:MAG: PP2C family protein-serine/threonine phosphatase [Daejeonella sp.]